MMDYLSIFIISIFIFQSSCSPPPLCLFGTARKYIGYFYTETGSTDTKPYHSTTEKDVESCRLVCRFNDTCFAVSYDEAATRTCSFYNTNHFLIVSDMSLKFYLWMKCNWALSIQPRDGRCRGAFVQYLDRAVDATSGYLILGNVTADHETNCLQKCLSHPLCEAVNLKKSAEDVNCTLHQLWPERLEKEVQKDGTNLYKWTCLPNFVDDIFLYKSSSQPNMQKCTGYWAVTARNASLPNLQSLGVYFHTQSYNSCLSECTENPSCHYALFNVTYSLCVLPFTESSDRNNRLLNLTFVEFQWICLKNDSRTPEMNDYEKKFQRMGFRCVQLVDNSDVYISEDNCGHIPTPGSFVRCQSSAEDNKWTVTDLCLVNQCFWRFPTNATKSRVVGHDRYNVTRTFNGLASFWMAYRGVDVFKEVNPVECRRFDGSRSKEGLEHHEIIARKEWFAYNSQGKLNNFTMKPTNIVLTASQQPFYGCRTARACTSLLRNLQTLYFTGAGNTVAFSDIPYNFMLDERGNIYETRGWSHECAAVYPYNTISLCFAFIGRFKDMYPMIRFLEKMKRLIEFAVEKNYVSANYTLYIHQDLTKSQISPNYAIVIKNWYRYRGYLPKDCSNITSYTAAVNLFLVLVSSVTLFVFYRTSCGVKDCKKCNFLHLVNLDVIYPKEETLESFGCLQMASTNCIVTKKQFLYSQSGHDKFIKMMKLWFLNKQLESSSSKRADCDLGAFLNYLGALGTLKVYDAYISNYRRTKEENLRVIFCCADQDLYSAFHGLTSSKSCVCQYFTIDFFSFNNLEFENV